MKFTRSAALTAAAAMTMTLVPPAIAPASAADQEPDPGLENVIGWVSSSLPWMTRSWDKASGQVVYPERDLDAAREYLISIGAVKPRETDIPWPFDDRQLNQLKPGSGETTAAGLDRAVARGTSQARGALGSAARPGRGFPEWPDGAIPTHSYADMTSLYDLAASARVNAFDGFGAQEPGFLTYQGGNRALQFVAQEMHGDDEPVRIGAREESEGEFWAVRSGDGFDLVPYGQRPGNQVAQVLKSRIVPTMNVRAFFLACKKTYGAWSAETGLINRVTVNPDDKTEFSSNDPSCVPLGHNLMRPDLPKREGTSGAVHRANYTTEPLRDLLVESFRDGGKRYNYPWNSDSWILYAEAVPLNDYKGVNWTRVPRGRTEIVVPRTWFSAYQPFGEAYRVQGQDTAIAILTLASWGPGNPTTRTWNKRVAEEAVTMYVCEGRDLKPGKTPGSLRMDDAIMAQAIKDEVCKQTNSKVLETYRNGRPVDHADNHQVAVILPNFSTLFGDGVGKSLVIRNSATYADDACGLFWRNSPVSCPAGTGDTLSDLKPGWNAQYRFGEVPLGFAPAIPEGRFRDLLEQYQTTTANPSADG